MSKEMVVFRTALHPTLHTLFKMYIIGHLSFTAGSHHYQSRELIEVPIPIMTPEETKTDVRRLKVNELLERARSTHWEKVHDGSEEGTALIIEALERPVNRSRLRIEPSFVLCLFYPIPLLNITN